MSAQYRPFHGVGQKALQRGLFGHFLVSFFLVWAFYEALFMVDAAGSDRSEKRSDGRTSQPESQLSACAPFLQVSSCVQREHDRETEAEHAGC
jgi:hypothetical protein